MAGRMARGGFKHDLRSDPVIGLDEVRKPRLENGLNRVLLDGAVALALGLLVAAQAPVWRAGVPRFLTRPDFKVPLVRAALFLMAFCLWASASALWSPSPYAWRLSLGVAGPALAAGVAMLAATLWRRHRQGAELEAALLASLLLALEWMSRLLYFAELENLSDKKLRDFYGKLYDTDKKWSQNLLDVINGVAPSLPTVRDIGLWSERVQKAYAELGGIQYAQTNAQEMLDRDAQVAADFDRQMKEGFKEVAPAK